MKEVGCYGVGSAACLSVCTGCDQVSGRTVEYLYDMVSKQEVSKMYLVDGKYTVAVRSDHSMRLIAIHGDTDESEEEILSSLKGCEELYAWLPIKRKCSLSQAEFKRLCSEAIRLNKRFIEAKRKLIGCLEPFVKDYDDGTRLGVLRIGLSNNTINIVECLNIYQKLVGDVNDGEEGES